MFTSVTAFRQTTILPFVMEVKSDNAGSSPSNQFTLTGAELRTGTTFDVNFSPIADPTNITEVILNVSSPTITFPSTGSFIVRVDDKKFNRIRFDNTGDAEKVLTITQWGDIQWSTMGQSFLGCSNMDVTATDYPNLSKVTDMRDMFRGCSNLVGTSDFGDWDVSNVTSLRSTFNLTPFNQDIGGWDVSNVTTMLATFAFGAGGIGFNQNIGGWNVSNVTDMASMFRDNTSFNQDISGWDVSNVIVLQTIFDGASAFNQNLGAWQLNDGVRGSSGAQEVGAAFRNSGMSCANWTDTIVGWANYVNTTGIAKNRQFVTNSPMTFANDRSGGAGFANSGAARTYLTGSNPPNGGWTMDETVQASC